MSIKRNPMIDAQNNSSQEFLHGTSKEDLLPQGVLGSTNYPTNRIDQLRKNLSRLEQLQSKMIFMVDEIRELIVKS